MTAPPFWLHIVHFYAIRSAYKHITATWELDVHLPIAIVGWC